MAVRHPIVSVMGHVDHGKSTILDMIRGTEVVSREAGGITQHIGATDVPIETIYKLCGPLIGDRKFNVPGLLFIDTPGHYSFVTLRTRGGALSDLAVLVIDVIDGIKPQTVESISILRKGKTPFVIAANKIDLIPGWRHHDMMPFHQSLAEQDPRVAADLDTRLYNISGKIFDQTGFSADRFDKITDFTKTIAMVPISGKFGEGLPDLLLILVGLAQRFLEDELITEEGAGEGTVLEVKEERGIGTAIDSIIYKGTIKVGDQIVVSSVKGEPIVTKVKGLQRPRPLDEIRDPTQRFDRVKEVSAAAGIRIVAQTLENAMAGGMIRVVNGDLDEIKEEIRQQSVIKVDLAEEGIIVRGDAIGSLEAFAFECKKTELPIRKIDIGSVTRKDVVEASHFKNPVHQAIFAFNVPINDDARSEARSLGVKIFENDVMYRLLEDYNNWCEERKKELEVERRLEVVFPGKIIIMRDHVFRVSKPAIVGVRVLAGRIRPGQGLVKLDGKSVGKIKSLRSGEESLKEAVAGQEIAVAIDEPTVGRQIDVEDVLLVDVPESHVAELAKFGLKADEIEVLEQLRQIKRKERQFWGA
ncbi:MAG: translation initiation factor IF-2 [Euryarchaeota archaeon RBG_13_57_23]|nr:MAG: translation initiation factor IF-2 [Euryarchaeota archaeon RBG_13_57_23]